MVFRVVGSSGLMVSSYFGWFGLVLMVSRKRLKSFFAKGEKRMENLERETND